VNDDLPESARITLAKVAEYRAAAKRAATADRPVRRKCAALLNLRELAVSEPDVTVRAWAEATIWREAAPFLSGRQASPAGDAYERAVRRLRAKGYVNCPRCCSPLPTEGTLDRWRLIGTEGL
jgi:hypothetical protein